MTTTLTVKTPEEIVKFIIQMPAVTEETKPTQLEVPLYISPAFERNEKRFGNANSNEACICCARPMKENEGKLIHMTIFHTALHNSIIEEADATALGFYSQGYFPIGNSCAKKMPKEFIHG